VSAVGSVIGQLYRVEETINGAAPDHRRGERQKRSKPIAEAIWADETVRKLSCKSELAAAFHYMRGRWPGLGEAAEADPKTALYARASRWPALLDGDHCAVLCWMIDGVSAPWTRHDQEETGRLYRVPAPMAGSSG
jgi:hypothetical protein